MSKQELDTESRLELQKERRLKDGFLFDRFRIIRHLGSGGMGDVYYARDTERFIDVALKVLDREQPRYEKLIKRFVLEAEIYEKLSHPNIVAIVARGNFQHYDYLALEYINGGTLLQHLRENPILPIEDVTSIMVDLIYAIHAAHQRGVIHRDIKPHNIMITEMGTAKLIDFGVAKEGSIISDAAEEGEEITEIESPRSKSGETLGASSSSGTTGTGHVVGTMAYSSPEQLQCQTIDGRTDIYCLGLVLYELLTGLRPISGHTVAEILLSQSNLDTKLVPPSSIRDEVPAELDEFVMKMVRYSPAERQQSSLELIEFVNSLSILKGKEEEEVLATATRHKAKNRNLASLELSDTQYWKAMELFEENQLVQGMKEFDKLCKMITEIPKQLARTMGAKLDHLFLTAHPIVPTLRHELPSIFLNDRVEFPDFIEILCRMIVNYHRLSRPVSSVVTWIRLFNYLDLAQKERPDVYEECLRITDSFEEKKEWTSTWKYIENLRTTIAEGRDEKELHGSESPALMTSSALCLVMRGNYEEALTKVKKILSGNRKNNNAIILAALILEEQGIHIPSYVDENKLSMELFLILGLFKLAVEERKNALEGTVGDLSIYQEIVDVYLRAGLEGELWDVYYKMAVILLEQESHDEARKLMKKSLSISHNSEEIINRIKNLKNAHRLFSISELSTLVKKYEESAEA